MDYILVLESLILGHRINYEKIIIFLKKFNMYSDI